MNLRPSGYEPDELPDCSTPRQLGIKRRARGFGSNPDAREEVVKPKPWLIDADARSPSSVDLAATYSPTP